MKNIRLKWAGYDFLCIFYGFMQQITEIVSINILYNENKIMYNSPRNRQYFSFGIYSDT